MCRAEALLQCYISALLLAFLLLVIVHMCVLHSYSNLASEIMRFADRQFYGVSNTIHSHTSIYSSPQRPGNEYSLYM